MFTIPWASGYSTLRWINTLSLGGRDLSAATTLDSVQASGWCQTCSFCATSSLLYMSVLPFELEDETTNGGGSAFPYEKGQAHRFLTNSVPLRGPPLGRSPALLGSRLSLAITCCNGVLTVFISQKSLACSYCLKLGVRGAQDVSFPALCLRLGPCSLLEQTPVAAWQGDGWWLCRVPLQCWCPSLCQLLILAFIFIEAYQNFLGSLGSM